MIEVGQIMELKVAESEMQGYWLTDGRDGSKRVWLPRRHVSQVLIKGERIKVFIYNDGQGRLIASLKTPRLFPGEIALLTAVNVTKAGAFLDWGLESDLFLPVHKARRRLVKGQSYLVALVLDQRQRLRATLDIYDYLSSQSPYQVNDMVNGIVYAIKEELGAFVAVDQRYYGLIPRTELYKNLQYGDSVQARVMRVREDGKLDLSLRKLAYRQMYEDAEKIYAELVANQGFLPLYDKSTPEDIMAYLEISKSAFKRALGHLLKEGIVEKAEQGIRLIKKV